MGTVTVQELDSVVIRFAGDSGDGMQLTGERFGNVSGILGNDIATFPDFPAEIRAPAGTTYGVSAYQVQIADYDVTTPGDTLDVLVAMNPAALKVHLPDVVRGGIVIVNTDGFTQHNLDRAGYTSNPLEDGTLQGYRVYRIPMTTLTLEAVKEVEGIGKKEAERSKNFFALGVVSWLFGRNPEVTEEWIRQKFRSSPAVMEANLKAFRAGYHYGETAEIFEAVYRVKPARLEPGLYRNITGNQAMALGLVAAAHQARLTLYYASYPITPASDLLHELARLKNFGVKTFQAEDEIAAAGAALGASYGGALGVTGTSGPGLDLKQETIGLAVMLELPLVVIDNQRGGPSTGLPTKSEQTDLLTALFGRHGEAPLPVIAAYSPAHCFWAALEAVRIALKYRTPLILLSDGYIANASEPFRIPSLDELPEIAVSFASEPNRDGEFWPYLRDPETLARPWVLPGTPGLEHRVGGLEKDERGRVSYDFANHDRMVKTRAEKVRRIARDIPPARLDADGGAELLVVSWGSTWGSVAAAVRRLRERGVRMAWTHLVHLNPLPPNLGEVVKSFPKVVVPENNLGQLLKVIRAEYLVDAKGVNSVEGRPFRASDLEEAFLEVLGERAAEGAR